MPHMSARTLRHWRWCSPTDKATAARASISLCVSLLGESPTVRFTASSASLMTPLTWASLAEALRPTTNSASLLGRCGHRVRPNHLPPRPEQRRCTNGASVGREAATLLAENRPRVGVSMLGLALPRGAQCDAVPAPQLPIVPNPSDNVPGSFGLRLQSHMFGLSRKRCTVSELDPGKTIPWGLG